MLENSACLENVIMTGCSIFLLAFTMAKKALITALHKAGGEIQLYPSP